MLCVCWLLCLCVCVCVCWLLCTAVNALWIEWLFQVFGNLVPGRRAPLNAFRRKFAQGCESDCQHASFAPEQGASLRFGLVAQALVLGSFPVLLLGFLLVDLVLCENRWLGILQHLAGSAAAGLFLVTKQRDCPGQGPPHCVYPFSPRHFPTNGIGSPPLPSRHRLCFVQVLPPSRLSFLSFFFC